MTYTDTATGDGDYILIEPGTGDYPNLIIRQTLEEKHEILLEDYERLQDKFQFLKDLCTDEVKLKIDNSYTMNGKWKSRR